MYHTTLIFSAGSGIAKDTQKEKLNYKNNIDKKKNMALNIILNAIAVQNVRWVGGVR